MSQKSLPSNPKGAEAIGSKDKSGIYIYICFKTWQQQGSHN